MSGDRPETIVELAQRLGVTRQLIGRLYARGYTAEQIVERVRVHLERKAAREAAMDALHNMPVTPIEPESPYGAPPVNGAGEIPSFAESERRKEFYLSEKHRIETEKLRGALLPLEPLRAITVAISDFQRFALERWPEELAMELGMCSPPEIARILQARVEQLFRATQSFFEGECKKRNITLPPAPPPRPVSARLADHEQYVLGSVDGEKEHITSEQWINSPEWHARFPGHTIQQGFEILAEKRGWDAEMAALLNRRYKWDLFVERPAYPSAPSWTDEAPPPPPPPSMVDDDDGEDA
jgi:hypothetical protein